VLAEGAAGCAFLTARVGEDEGVEVGVGVAEADESDKCAFTGAGCAAPERRMVLVTAETTAAVAIAAAMLAVVRLSLRFMGPSMRLILVTCKVFPWNWSARPKSRRCSM
jgi:hypothetical protein